MSDKITLHFRAVDGDWDEKFDSLKEAQEHCNKFFGGEYEYVQGFSYYVVNFYGDVTMTCSGCTLDELMKGVKHVGFR